MIEPPKVPRGFEEINYIDSDQKHIVRLLVFLHGDKCWYCDKEFVEEAEHRYSRTLDHFHSQRYARDRGWNKQQTHGLGNLVLAHQGCNSNKGDRDWLDDGTLSPKKPIKPVKGPRPVVCDTCLSGRILLMDETCPDCGSGPQPARSPRAYQVSPKECTHSGLQHCYMCWLGLLPREDKDE